MDSWFKFIAIWKYWSFWKVCDLRVFKYQTCRFIWKLTESSLFSSRSAESPTSADISDLASGKIEDCPQEIRKKNQFAMNFMKIGETWEFLGKHRNLSRKVFKVLVRTFENKKKLGIFERRQLKFENSWLFACWARMEVEIEIERKGQWNGAGPHHILIVEFKMRHNGVGEAKRAER